MQIQPYRYSINKEPYPLSPPPPGGVLQVEQLFRLGLRSRAECEELLQRCQWGLEESCRILLDTYPNKTCKWKRRTAPSAALCPRVRTHVLFLSCSC